MPLPKLQSHVLRLLAAERSPDSYIAGGVAINREGPRFSGDVDIFQDTEQLLKAAAEADEKTLTAAGLKLSWKKIVTGRCSHKLYMEEYTARHAAPRLLLTLIGFGAKKPNNC